MMRAVGKGVAANQRLVAPRDVELEGEILARLEWGQRLAVVRLQIERANVLALARFFGDGELPVAIPNQSGLLDLLTAQFGFLNLQAQLGQGQALLGALGIEPQQASGNFDEDLNQQRRSEKQPDGQTQFYSGQRVQGVK